VAAAARGSSAGTSRTVYPSSDSLVTAVKVLPSLVSATKRAAAVVAYQ
jgi:hypothetical protein